MSLSTLGTITRSQNAYQFLLLVIYYSAPDSRQLKSPGAIFSLANFLKSSRHTNLASCIPYSSNYKNMKILIPSLTLSIISQTQFLYFPTPKTYIPQIKDISFSQLLQYKYNKILQQIQIESSHMSSSRKKFINVTCNAPIKNKVDSYLKDQYALWKSELKNKKVCRPISVIANVNLSEKNKTEKRCKNNQLLKQYISHIYQEYDIVDPLLGQDAVPQFKTINRVKSQFILEKESPQVMVNQPSERGYESYPTRFNNQTPMKITRDAQNKYLLTNYTQKSQSHTHSRNRSGELPNPEQRTLFDSAKYPVYSHPVHPHPRIIVEQTTARKLFSSKGHDNPIKIQEQSEGIRNSENERSDFVKMPVEESYRYCLACQTPILSCNIKEHEKVCIKFQSLLAADIKGILQHLSVKIQEFNDRIENNFAQQWISNRDIDHLRTCSVQLKRESKQISQNGQITHRFTKNYEKMITIGKKFASMSEQVNKIRWFIRVREIIKKDYNL